MKRIGGLFERMASASTFTQAAWQAAQGKHQRPEVRAFLAHLESEMAKIIHALRAGSFRFGEYRTFSIRDPKSRVIHAPPFRDRVVHHALIIATGPVFERGAIAHSYACRKGRGQHAALGQVCRWLRPQDWFLKLDVAKFYDSVPHEVLRCLLARRFRERKLLNLFDHLLDSYQRSPGKGLPIGALTSQYLGNFYLDAFDHWANQTAGQHRYLRYMDDMVFLGDLPTLRHMRRSAAVVLEGLGLRIKNGGVLNRAALGLPCLGFVIYPDRVRLNQPGRQRLIRRLKTLEHEWETSDITERELQARGEALFAHARFGDDLAWRQMVCRRSRFGETQAPDPRPAGWFLEQFRQELPLGVSQQEQAG